MKILLTISLMIFLSKMSAQNIEPLSYNDLNSKVIVSNDTLYVLNFWATWCEPCVKELPYFEKSNSEFQNKKIKIILVNLDFNSKIKTVAEPFVAKKNIKSKVVHITDTDPNSWINKVDSSWSGAIPATVMYRKKRKVFFKEGPVMEDELTQILMLNTK